MNSGQKLLISSGAASLVAPAIFTAYLGLNSNFTATWALVTFVVAWVVTVFHLLLLGLPIFIILERVAGLKWMAVVVAGFTAGFVPLGVLTFPLFSVGDDNSGSNVWLTYILSCSQFGLLGTITAITLWRTLLSVEGRPSLRT